jgi:tetratricopeptide (TPR) repeat protein
MKPETTIFLAAFTICLLMACPVSAQTAQEYCSSAYELYKQKRSNEAIPLLERALQLAPNLADIYYIRGVIRFHSLNRLADAKADFDRAIVLNPLFGVAYAERATLLQKQKQFAEALADMDNAIKLDPEASMLHESRANVLIDMSRYNEAVNDLSRCLSVKPDQPGLLASRAHAYIKLKNWREALPDLNRGIELKPDSGKYARRSWVYFNLKDYSRALDDIAHALAEEPDLWTPYQTRGYIFKLQEKYEAAIAELNKSLQLRPAEGDTLECRGDCYQGLKQYDRALSDYTEALKGEPEYRYRVFGKRALVYRIKKDYEKAISDCNASLKIKANYSEAMLLLARCHHDLGANGKAIADCSNAIKLNPADREALYLRAEYFKESGDNARALADYTNIIKRNPKDYEALCERARIYYTLEEYGKAIADETTIINQVPNSAMPWRRRGFYRMVMGEYRDALEDHNVALRLAPDDSYFLLSIALVHTGMGGYGQAIADCDKVLKQEAGKTGKKEKEYLAVAAVRKAKALSLSGHLSEAAEQLAKVLSSDSESLRSFGELKLAEESYRLTRHIQAAVARGAAARGANPSGGQLDEMDRGFAHSVATEHFAVFSDEGLELITYYADFAEAFRRFLDRELVKTPAGPAVRIYLFTNQEKLADFSHKNKLPNLHYAADYWSDRNAILTHAQVTLAPLAFEIAGRAIALGLSGAETWAQKGIPDLFMKFYGYFEGPDLNLYYGYENFSCLSAFLSDPTKLKLSNIIAITDPKRREPTARLLAVFLQVNHKLPEYLRLVRSAERGKYKSFVEAAFQGTTAELEHDWRKYLAWIAHNARDWMNLPASEVFESKSELNEFMHKNRIPMPGETIQPDAAPDAAPPDKPVAIGL